jgi:hypothetical protein
MGQPELSEAFDAVSLQGLDEVFSAEPVPKAVAGETDQALVPVSEPVTTGPEPVPAQVLEPVTNESGPDTVPIEQAASILGTSVAALKKRLRRGTIRGIKAESKHGEKWFVDASELPGEPIAAPVTGEVEPVPAPVIEPVASESEPVPAPIPDLVTVNVEAVPEPTSDTAEYQRLISIIESQAHQLKAAGDVIVYLKSEVEEAKSQIKLLTGSQHKTGKWAQFWSWFTGRK